MPRRADITLASTSSSTQWAGGGTQYVVQTPAGVIYIIYTDTGGDVSFKKSSDYGLTWSVPVDVSGAITLTNLSVWYDRWSGLATDLIHVCWAEGAADDISYRTINAASSDALSNVVVVFAGGSTATGGRLSIARSRGGNVYINGVIDAGAEGGFWKLANADVPNGAWSAALTNPEALATTDQIILAPGFAADANDMLAIFWDASANQISRYIYDDSANTWAESIFGAPDTFTDTVATTAFPNFAITVDLTNSQLIVVAWNAVDAANADLKCYTVTEGAITAKTDVVLNSTDDQGLAGICLHLVTGYWWVFYVGKSDGSETYGTSTNVYCKCSQDSGTTWSAELKLSNQALDITWLITCMRQYLGNPIVAYHSDTVIDEIIINIDIMQPKASYQIGI